MYDAIFVTPWPWWIAGPALGLVVVLTAWLGGKAVGVSTAYGSVCAVTSRLSFFRAKEFHESRRVWFVLGLPLGGLVTAAVAGAFAPSLAYGSLDTLTNGSLAAKAGLLFGGGILIGAGARWAGGCPSGHSIVGIAQGSAASLVATMGYHDDRSHTCGGASAGPAVTAGIEDRGGGVMANLRVGLSRMLFALLVLGLLGGCAAPGPAPRAQDFPSHDASPPFFALHWRLDREAGQATAVGVVEVSAPERINGLTVELQALDSAGRVVARSYTVAWPRSFDGRVPWPFTARLRLRGGEDRFAVRVSDYRDKFRR